MATIDFKPHTDAGNPAFDNVIGGRYGIICASGDRGRWLGLSPDEAEEGESVHLKVATVTVGQALITWWAKVEPWQYLGSTSFDPGPIDEVVPILAGATRFRIELRLWEEGEAEFGGIDVVYPHVEVEPPIEPEPLSHVYQLSTPDLQSIWTVTISDDGITTTKCPAIVENDYINEMAETEPDEPAELPPPVFDTEINITRVPL